MRKVTLHKMKDGHILMKVNGKQVASYRPGEDAFAEKEFKKMRKTMADGDRWMAARKEKSK